MTAKHIYKLALSDPDLESKIQEINRQILEQSPEHIKELGRILRSKSLFWFKLFLKEQGHAGKVPDELLPLFMDHLITLRTDLKDIADESRERLRQYTLRCEPKSNKTDDYVEHVEQAREPVTCKRCEWFVGIPIGEDKSCVELGAHGVDKPCFGFTLKGAMRK